MFSLARITMPFDSSQRGPGSGVEPVSFTPASMMFFDKAISSGMALPMPPHQSDAFNAPACGLHELQLVDPGLARADDPDWGAIHLALDHQQGILASRKPDDAAGPGPHDRVLQRGAIGNFHHIATRLSSQQAGLWQQPYCHRANAGKQYGNGDDSLFHCISIA